MTLIFCLTVELFSVLFEDGAGLLGGGQEADIVNLSLATLVGGARRVLEEDVRMFRRAGDRMEAIMGDRDPGRLGNWAW